MTLEIAVFNIQSALLAAQAGADRLELCENPEDGGTTPSYGTLKTIKENIFIAVFPIIRKQSGFEGIVIGLLNKDATVDVDRTKRLVKLAYPLEVTFHRAFDRTKDASQSLEDIIECGCQRILTSGQVPNAFDGKDLIKKLIEQADDRIIIMPGSGVRSNNIHAIANYTGAAELHSSAKKNIHTEMEFINKGMNETLQNISVDENEIRKMKAALNT